MIDMAWTNKYTDREMITLILDKEEIQKVMSRRSFYIANDWRRKELDDLWVQQPENKKTASYGSNYGYYVGMSDIARWYVTDTTRRRFEELKPYCDADPSIEYDDKNLGIGLSMFHPIGTPYIYVAEDRKTARAMFYSIGEDTYGANDAFWLNEKVAIDFANENGQWKIWHLVVSNDFCCRPGVPFSALPVYAKDGEDMPAKWFGTPTLPMQTHEPAWNWADDYPAIPKPYDTFDEKDSYAPAGHPNFNSKGGRWR